MKKRQPKITDKKLRGEWAEMIFMARATELGLPVSKPWGEARSYDFVVGRPGRFVAVQVKSTTCALQQGWICKLRTGSKPYPPGSFDFLAAYIVFENAWYIIPEEEVLGMDNITLHTGSSWANYEKYREAWRLLGPDRDPGKGRIDIQACAEEFSSDAPSMEPENFNAVKVGRLCLDFLSLPQRSLALHSFCTSGERFSIVTRPSLPQSVYIECVNSLKLAG